ncbi:MAG: hypothetical protein EOR72_32430 [Mesorhizobium sp.]|nr:MAG: hypothetical protein EOR72_32430 [Mesorhizobium sp.]
MFAAFREGSCSLCGSTQNLTGEHKIKASALRSEFGPDSMMIGRFGEPNENMKLAQGVKSEIFHFASQLCAPCNNSRSQAADREFDRFHTIARDLMAKGEDPNHVFNNARYAVTSEAYLNVFRYFAKLLCCHLADVGAPRPVHMSRFALGQVNTNCVWLDVNHDWTYQQTSVEFGPHKYAAHGGLAIYGDAKTGGANAFHSTLTVGSLRYVFYSRLNWFERLELRLAHRNFYEFCREQVQKSIDRPLSQEDYLRLGLTAKQPTEK